MYEDDFENWVRYEFVTCTDRPTYPVMNFIF